MKNHFQLRNLVLFVFIFSAFFSQAQRARSFSGDVTTFAAEIQAFYKTDKNLDKDQLKQYEALVLEYDGVFQRADIDQKATIMDISNLLLQYRVRPMPEFYNFLKVQIALSKSSQSAESIDAWYNGILLVLKTKKMPLFNDAIESTESLLSGNSFYDSRTARWSSSSDEYYFRAGETLEIVFDTPMDLTYSSKLDSNYIKGTKGVFYPATKDWVGKGGKIFWERTGLAENECWAELKDYKVDAKFTKFTIDSVVFVNAKYFKKPLYGKLIEDIGVAMAPEKYSYPRFRSYEKEFTLPNIFANIDYTGGFSMNGAKFIASGVDKEYVYITIMKNKKPFMKLEGKTFYITEDRITSSSVAATIYVGSDSIFNAGLQFKYLKDGNDVSLLNASDRNFYSPFENSYHKLDMYCNYISWQMNSDSMTFSDVKGTVESSAIFESEKYFSARRYNEIRGIDNQNPLDRVRNYCLMRKTTHFYIDEFATYLRYDIIQTKSLLHGLAKYGFVNVNNEDDMVYVKNKLFDFAKSNLKAIDYDAITLISATNNNHNASLNLKNFDLELYGVSKFLLSDTHNVVIAPKDETLIVKKNRDLFFDGRILAGRFDMIARKCYFDYNQFKIDLPAIDSLKFFVTSFHDDAALIRIRTALQDIKGELLIDKGDNKASLKPMDEYPIFNSLDYSYAYYSAPTIQEGVYDNKRFYYKLEPFTIKRLFKFKTDSLMFAGKLVSAGIFPDLNEPLKVQQDYSLGFIMNTPAQGLPLYGGKGQYKQTIDLSNKGLLGRGEVQYLASYTKSKDIVFMPDTMKAITDTFYIREDYAGGDFPDTKVGRIVQKWYPYKDEMHLFQDKNPFNMYGNKMDMNGHLVLTPKGLKGAGVSKLDVADISSDGFTFRKTAYQADSSDFKLKSEDNKALVFNGKNLKAKIDMQTRQGEFVSNDSISQITLDVIQYRTFANKFIWKMDKAELALQNTKSVQPLNIATADITKLLSMPMPGAEYVSLHPQQNKLNFFATTGNFKYKENVLNADEVHLIRVADAAIAPDNKKVTVRAQAQMDKIAKAKILADTNQKFHLFYNSEVQISGKNSYLASGTTDYIDENKTKRPIFFAEIKPNAALVTEAHAHITDSLNFLLSPAFGFKGEVIAQGNQKYYTFKGGVQLKHKCFAQGESLAWTKFQAVIVPDSIYIPIPEVPSEFNGQRVTASILFDKKDLRPYAAFLTQDKAVDNEFISANGYLTFNKKTNEYRIGGFEKIRNPEEGSGNMLTLNQTTCDVKADGKLKFEFRQDHTKMLTDGAVKINNVKGECDMNLMVGLNFPFAQKALDFMNQNIQDDLGLETMNYDDPKIKKALKERLGEQKGTEAAEELLSMGAFKKFPNELDYTILIDNVRLKYNPDPRVGYTYSGTIGVWKTGSMQQYRKMRGGVQIRRYRGASTLNIYLEVTPDEWYFFSYEEVGKKSTLRASSNLEEFNDMIKEIPSDQRQIAGKDNKGTYTYGPVMFAQKDNFIRTIQGLKTDEVLEDEGEEEEVIEEAAPKSNVTPETQKKEPVDEEETDYEE